MCNDNQHSKDNWIKLCPTCGKEQKYKRKSALVYAVKHNKSCFECKGVRRGASNGMFGKTHSDAVKKKLSETAKKTFTGIQKSDSWKQQARERQSKFRHTEDTKKKLRKPKSEQHKQKLRKPKSEEAKKKMRESHRNVSGKNNPMYGSIRHDVRKRKLRALELNGITPRTFYNPIACKAIDEYGKLHGYKFQHAENGGEFYIKELGYWVDGYDVEQNVVIEYDEKHHNTTRQKNKDVERQRLITEHLGCKFIRIGE